MTVYVYILAMALPIISTILHAIRLKYAHSFIKWSAYPLPYTLFSDIARNILLDYALCHKTSPYIVPLAIFAPKY